MARIQFTRLVISPTYGNCGPGDIVQCSEAFARHCVEGIESAVYLDAPPVKVQHTPRKRGGKRVATAAAG